MSGLLSGLRLAMVKDVVFGLTAIGFAFTLIGFAFALAPTLATAVLLITAVCVMLSVLVLGALIIGPAITTLIIRLRGKQ